MRKLLLFFILSLSLPSIGQQITIPYRDGDKWGVSDREGKLIIAPKFDSISFGHRYGNKPGDMISWSRGKKGLITGGKELLPAEYSSIISDNEYIRAEKVTPEAILTYIYSSDGTPIVKEGIIHIGLLAKEHGEDKDGSYNVLLLQYTAANNRESAFIWSSREKAVVQWLAKDVHSVALESVKGRNYALLRIREKADGPVILSHFKFGRDGRLHQMNKRSEIPIDKESNREAQIEPYEINGDISIASPIGDIDMGVAVPNEGGGSGVGIGKESNGRYGSEQSARTAAKKPVNVYKTYKKENNGILVLERRDAGAKVIKSKMKFTPDSFTVKNFSNSQQIGDTLFYYSNYVLYMYKGRSGILKDGQSNRGNEYDELTGIHYTSQKTGKRSAAFIAGKRHKQSKAIKYGLIDFEGKEIIPFVYDELTTAATSASPGYDLLAKRNGRYEIITADNQMIISGLDEVNDRKQDGKAYLELRRGDKYGVFLRSNGEHPFKIEPSFPYPVKSIRLTYPGENLWVARPGANPKVMPLIELMDNEGNTKGYAGEDGFLYFKD